MKTKLLGRFSGGFSMVELLIIVGVMAVLMALIISPAAQISKGMALTSAGQMLEGQLALARQTAISKNRCAEVRFYELPDASGTQKQFRALQVYLYDEKGLNPKPLGKLLSLPQGMVIEVQANGGSAQSSSTLIDFAPEQDAELVPSVGATCAYRGFRFRGNGVADLDLNGPNGSGNTWFLTARATSDLAKADSKNFYTVQIDPLTGQIKSFRP